jgi:hypothetical protein
MSVSVIIALSLAIRVPRHAERNVTPPQTRAFPSSRSARGGMQLIRGVGLGTLHTGYGKDIPTRHCFTPPHRS